MKKALVIYANGSEDLEVTAVADVLSRGGIAITRGGVGGRTVKLAHGTIVTCDAAVEECAGDFDAIVIPGGLDGSSNCAASEALVQKLKQQRAAGRWVCAICAAPGFVLARHGLLDGGVRATCYPGCNDSAIAALQPDGVVKDGAAHVITGKGPGFAIPFALTILEALAGTETREKVEAGMLLR